jgi:hypothetical protein
MGLSGAEIFFVFLVFIALLTFSIASIIRKQMDWKLRVFWLILVIAMPFIGMIVFWSYSVYERSFESIS